MNFQWDYLLLEAGFLAILLPTGSPIAVWLFRWLLFRLRFFSGVSKLVSGDPAWAGFTALGSYFETQPLPHVGAWYAHHLPDWLLRLGTGATLFVVDRQAEGVEHVRDFGTMAEPLLAHREAELRFTGSHVLIVRAHTLYPAAPVHIARLLFHDPETLAAVRCLDPGLLEGSQQPRDPFASI